MNRTGKKSVEVVYLITSADHPAAPPGTLAARMQGHWCVENRLHWVRRRHLNEDRSQVRTGQGPNVMATRCNTATDILCLAGWRPWAVTPDG